MKYYDWEIRFIDKDGQSNQDEGTFRSDDATFCALSLVDEIKSIANKGYTLIYANLNGPYGE